MPFPDLPPERIPGSPEHLNDHQLIDQALDYIQQAGYRDDPNFPPLPDVPVLGQSGHVTAHDRILAILEYVKNHPMTGGWGSFSNTPTGTYKGDDGHNYSYVEFTSSGTLTVTAQGWLDVLVVGGGGGCAGKNGGGGGGGVRYGGFLVASGSYNVQVGAGGQAGTAVGGQGGASGVEGVLSVGGGGGGLFSASSVARNAGANGGGSPGGSAYTTSYPQPGGGAGLDNGNKGLTLSYTGAPVAYGAGGAHNTGGNGSSTTRGNPGVVIVRTRTN